MVAARAEARRRERRNARRRSGAHGAPWEFVRRHVLTCSSVWPTSSSAWPTSSSAWRLPSEAARRPVLTSFADIGSSESQPSESQPLVLRGAYGPGYLTSPSIE